MVNKLFGTIDFGKLALDTTSGFIVTTALLLLIDAWSPSHLVADILAQRSTGYIVVAGLIVIVFSSVLGLMVDSLYHTFGRRFAQKIWPSLDAELKYRKDLMKEIGLNSKDEFEWVQNNGKKISADDIEGNYMRFTEVSGSSAYATVFLSFAVALFLRWEYNEPLLLTGLVSFVIGVVAVILLFTSAASLKKYEMNKTATAMDEIRRLNPYFKTQREDRKGQGLFCIGSLWSLFFFLPIVIAACIGTVYNPNTTGTDMAVISAQGNGTVVVISINATGNLTHLGNISASQIISLDNTMYSHQKLSLVGEGGNNTGYMVSDNRTVDLVQLANLPEDPGWHLEAALGKDIAAGNVYLNVQLSFDNPDSSNLPTGNWILPVIVQDESGKEYLLAYVQVTINATNP